MTKLNVKSLLSEIEELQNRLEESAQLIDAIKRGEVDAFAIGEPNNSEVYTLQSGDYAYRVLIEEMQEGAINVTLEGLIVYSNSFFCRLLQLPYEKVVGRYLAEFIHPDSRTTFYSLFEIGLSEKSKGEITLSINGNAIPVYISLTSLQPKLPCVGIILSDLSEKKKHQKTEENEARLSQMVEERTAELEHLNRDLIKSKEHFAKLFDVSPVATSLSRISDGTFVDVNPAWEQMFQLEKEEAIGKRAQELRLTKHDDHDRLIEKALQQQGNLSSEELTFQLENGKVVHSYISAVTIILHGSPHLLTAYFDLTPRKNAEAQILKAVEELREKNMQLQQINEELESFNYIASHDLQEPLRKIQTFLALLVKNIDYTEEAKKYVDKTIESSIRMSALIQSVLNYSRISKAIPENFTKTDLNKVLDDSKSELELQIQEKKASVTSDRLPIIDANPQQLQQLFSNLISNSLKFSNEAPSIRITSKIVDAIKLPLNGNMKKMPQNGQFAEISFIDNGIGFDPQYAKKIFELFQRLHGKNEYAGTGIGLSIVKKIIEHHNGYITVNSNPGEGSTFTIWLPI